MFDLTNYRKHPSDSKYLVFHFTKVNQADYFESLLQNNNHFFERYNRVEGGKQVFYFAVKKVEEKAIVHLSNLAIGKFRNRFIPDATFRWLVFIISATVLSLAFIGYYKSLQ